MRALLTFRGGPLHFRADYIRSRRVKTDITVRSDGSVTVTTEGRGKPPLRRPDRLNGMKATQCHVAQTSPNDTPACIIRNRVSTHHNIGRNHHAGHQ